MLGGTYFSTKQRWVPARAAISFSINWNMQRLFSHKAPAPLHQVRVVHKGCKVAKCYVT
jgi:hypothetical protein